MSIISKILHYLSGRPYSYKAAKIFESAEQLAELDKAVDEERENYKSVMNGNLYPVRKSSTKIKRVGFGEYETLDEILKKKLIRLKDSEKSE